MFRPHRLLVPATLATLALTAPLWAPVLAARRVRAALAALLLTGTVQATPLEEYDTTGGTDFAPAFEAAQRACGGGPCRVDLGPRGYPISRTVEVCSSVSIVGEGLGAALVGSTVNVPRRTAFRVRRKNDCPYTPALDGRLNLERVTVVNTGGPSVEGDAPFYGVETFGRIELRDVGLSGFVHGVHADCASPAICGGFLENVYVVNSEHSSVYFRGPDASGFTVTTTHARVGCRNAARWNATAIDRLCASQPTHSVCSYEGWQCAGFQDLSFLGNTYVGTLTHAQYGHAGYVFAGASQATTAIGVYAEGDAITPVQYADAKCNVVGGQNTFAGPTGQWHGAVTPGLSVQHGDIRWDIGGQSGIGALWRLYRGTATAPWPWWLMVDTTGNLRWNIGNSVPIEQWNWRRP